MSESPSAVTSGPSQPLGGSAADTVGSAADKVGSAAYTEEAAPTPLVVDLAQIKNIPDNYRVMESTGNVVPQSMHSSSQSARKIYVVDGKEVDIPYYPPKAPSESTFDSQAIPGTEPDKDDAPPPEDPRKVARRERRLARIKASCEGCCYDPPFGHPSQKYHMGFGGCMDADRPEEDSDVSSNMSDDNDDDDPYPDPKARAGAVKRCFECSGLEQPLANGQAAKRAKVLVPETPMGSPNPTAADGSANLSVQVAFHDLMKTAKELATAAGVRVPETPEGEGEGEVVALRREVCVWRKQEQVQFQRAKAQAERASKVSRALDALIGHAVDKLGGDREEIEKLVDAAMEDVEDEEEEEE